MVLRPGRCLPMTCWVEEQCKHGVHDSPNLLFHHFNCSQHLFFLFPQPLGSLMNSAGRNCLAFSTKCSNTGARLPMGSDSTLSVTTSWLLSQVPPLCQQHGPFLSSLTLRALRDASTRRVNVLKCQRHPSLLSAFMAHDIYQKETIKSPRT